jgi:hypothetical protein
MQKRWKKGEKRGKRILNDLICDQYTNACKLSAKLR